MPHVTVRLYPGQSEEAKQALSDDIVNAIQQRLQSKEGSISIGFQEVTPEDWKEAVYEPEIVEKEEQLYKKPGYSF